VLVGLTKRTLKKALGRKLFPYHELATILTHVEAILNTRPLCYIESTHNTEEKVLTPADLLNIPNLGTFSELDRKPNPASYQSITKSQLIRRYKQVQKVINTFWQIRRGSYLQQLKEKLQIPKQRNYVKELPTIGDIVQIQNDKKPRIQWTVGRIIGLRFGRDQKIRSVEIRTPNGNILTRPVNALYPLEHF